MTNMKAAYYRGDRTFSVEPQNYQLPADDEVQIEIAYSGVCGTDLHCYLGHMDQRLGNDRIIGHEMSGIIAKVGADVSDWKAGDRVVVRPLDACGNCPACDKGHEHICHNLVFIGLDRDGAMQSFWNVPTHTLHPIPDNLSLQTAALAEPLAVAVHDVGRAQIKQGEDVLVIGGGPIGMLIAMVARQAGGNVVISEVNEMRLALAKKYGFSVINPTQDDVAQHLSKRTANKGMEVVFEVSGTQAGVDLMTQVGATRARIVMVAIHAQKPIIDLFQFFWRELNLLGARVYEPQDFDKAIALMAANDIDLASLITDVQPLENINEAFADLLNNPISMKTLFELNGDLD